MTTNPDRCICCGRTDIKRRPRASKARYPHRCPHGVPCLAGSPLARGGGFNGPPLGGPHFCPACVDAHNAYWRARRAATEDRHEDR